MVVNSGGDIDGGVRLESEISFSKTKLDRNRDTTTMNSMKCTHVIIVILLLYNTW